VLFVPFSVHLVYILCIYVSLSAHLVHNCAH